ncbi:2',5' RNA ligase [Calothrix sp. NIES-4101]|nr:2',5' RNA ligase [Calothrix sp. NIES-4101]
MELKRFFIAIIPPQHIQDFTNQVKQDFADNYASSAAQKSPPHITLQPPFTWDLHDISTLELKLQDFANIQKCFSIKLKNFSAFAAHVIFIDVVKTPELIQLQADLMSYMQIVCGILDQKSQNREFAPHLTVAFRDLTKQNFKLAWQKYENRELYFDFTVENIALLLHDGKRWNLKTELRFSR